MQPTISNSVGMGWSRFRGSVALLMACATLGLAAPVLADSFPAPGDDAALYAAAKKEGTLVWYSGAPQAAMKALALTFEKKYPGVKISLQRLVGMKLYQRFVQETDAGQHLADIVLIADNEGMKDMIDQGYIARWKVPTYDRFPEWAHMKDYAYANYMLNQAIAYNPNKVTPEEVEILKSGWKGILDPRFKGRIAYAATKCGSCYVALAMFLDPDLKDQFGVPYLKALAAQDLVTYNEPAMPSDRVVAGEQDIAFMSSESNNYTKWKSGAPVQWIHPSPTPAYANTWWGISKTAPHPNAARLFMDWAMSDEGAEAIQNDYGGPSTLEGVKDGREVTKQPWWDPITDIYKPDWDRWAKNYDSDFELWFKILDQAKAAGAD